MALGLIKRKGNDYLLGNPIYSNLIPKYLSVDIQEELSQTLIVDFINDKSIDTNGLLRKFQKFWDKHSEKYLKELRYLKLLHKLYSYFTINCWKREVL
jgi:hypothetical protein